MQAVGHATARLGVQYEGYLAIHRAATCHHARMQWRGHGACAQRCSEGGYVPSAWIATSFGDVATGDYRVPTCPASSLQTLLAAHMAAYSVRLAVASLRLHAISF